MQTKMAVIGDRGSVSGFKAVGFDVFEASAGASAASTSAPGSIEALISKLAGDGYGIIFVTEDIAAAGEGIMDMYKDDMLPAIIPIPGRKGSLNIGMDNIHRNVERAVGTDIFNNRQVE